VNTPRLQPLATLTLTEAFPLPLPLPNLCLCHYQVLKPSEHVLAPIYGDGVAEFAWVESNNGACAIARVWGDTTSSYTRGPREVASLPRPDSSGHHQRAQSTPGGYLNASGPERSSV
jgi:hypothetical protein